MWASVRKYTQEETQNMSNTEVNNNASKTNAAADCVIIGNSPGQITFYNPSSGTKHDSGKADLSLLPPAGLYGAAHVFAFGAKKYGRYNFMGGFEYSRLISAAMRHITAWMWGQDNDEESGLSHLDHAICCLLMLRQIMESKTGTDNRYGAPPLDTKK